MRFDREDTITRLAAFLQRWLRQHPGWSQEWNPATFMADWRSADEVAEALLTEVEFAELRLAPFLMSPEGELIRTAVAWVLPFPQNYEFKLLVEAITKAAGARTRDDRQTAGGWTIVAGIAAVLFLFGRE